MGKNNSIEYKELEDYSSFLKDMLSKDQYISRKEYIEKHDALSDLINRLDALEKDDVLTNWCKKNKTEYKKLLPLIRAYKNTEKEIKKHNDNYVNKHLEIDKDYLDKVLIKDNPVINLDEEQRRVVLSDEDYTLVIAGAGAGKTTTIEAKAKYLVEKMNVSPERILVVSFTKKATDELIDRFKKLEIPVNISTFHSVGNTIIRDNDGERHKIVDQGFMYRAVEDYLINKLDDKYFIRKLLLFFASYLNMPFEEENTTLLYKSLAANDTTTIKNDLSKVLEDYKNEQTKRKITIKDETVRSIDECRIANFLYIKGVDYVYEPVYQYCFDDTTKPYCPDFLIKNNGKEIYLEHFGITEDGKSNRYFGKELEEYKKRIKDKIEMHKKHGTRLIYTYSKYNDGRDLITHLEEILLTEGITFDAKDEGEIYRQLAAKAEDKYFTKFIMLVCNFINRFKVCNYDVNTKFDEWQYSIKNERTKLFLEIAKQCFYIYEAKRLEAKAIDFEDMINDAVNILDRRIKQQDYLPYDYIFVDEYQDISLQRFDLCEKLSKASKAKIIAVGDDWQSIFRFSGAQIELFTKFEEKMGYANILKITSTRRNSQELIDIAGGFVMENQKQIKKDLKSTKSIKDPVVLVSYDDTYNVEDKEHGPFYRLGAAVEKSLDFIVANDGIGSKVLLIGRYNFDGKNLGKLEDLFEWNNGAIKSKKYPGLEITFLTAHASKGLGRDNVVIINGKDDVLGFPSKIEDDTVMKLVVKDDESMDFEEERRLFYVAMTRTMNRVYIVTPQTRPSKFIMEIKDKFTNVILKGVELNPQNIGTFKHTCPKCGYPLQKRVSNFKFMEDTKKLWICSNDPEVCGFMTNNLNGNKYGFSISKCPDCVDGYLIVKPIKNKDASSRGDMMLGCTNYKNDGTGCSFTMNQSNYTQDKGKILVDEKGRVSRSFIKEDVNNMIKAISKIYEKYPNFLFGNISLLDFLIGKENKVISAFKLQGEYGFGLFKEKKQYWIKKVIEALFDLGVFESFKNEKGYINIKLLQRELSDSQVFALENIIY